MEELEYELRTFRFSQLHGLPGEVTIQAYQARGDGLAREAVSTAVEGDPTGLVTWPALPVLCFFILSDLGRAIIKGKNVHEVGAGVGVPGLLAARFCETVTLSDFDSRVVEQLRRSIELLGPDVACRAKAMAFSWGQEGPQQSHADVILGSDVVYSAASSALLLEAVDDVLSEGGYLVLSYHSRWTHVDRAFAAACQAAGFRLEDVPVGSFLPQALCPPDPKASLLVATRMRSKPWGASVGIRREGWEGDPETLLVGPSGYTESTKKVRVMRVRGSGPLSVPAERLERHVAQWGAGLELLDAADLWLGDEVALLVPLLAPARCPVLRGLELPGNDLGDAAALALAGLLPSMRALEALVLDRNLIGEGGSRALCRAARRSGSMTSLHLGKNRPGAGEGALAGLAAAPDARSSTSSLARLGLDDVSLALAPEGVGVDLEGALSAMPGLRWLDLSSSNLGAGAGALARALGGCAALVHLDVGYGGLGADGGGGLAVAVLAGCPGIASLEMRGNYLGDWGAARLAAALMGPGTSREGRPRGQCLVHLGLGSNSIGDEGADLLADAAADIPGCTLSLRGNCIGDEGARALVVARPHWLGLDLRDNALTGEGKGAIISEWEETGKEETIRV